jgi:glycosyltransferase involved in cell wall biosynthesis
MGTKMNLFFSVIIPTYNSGSCLSKAIESVLRQTYTDFEIVLADGGSKDDTIAVAKSYNDSRIQIYSEPDKGVYDAMNKGMNWATGEWMYFIGSDDYFYNDNVLQTMAQQLQKTKHHVLYGNVLVQGNTGWATGGQVYDGEFSFQKLLGSNICHQSMFYRRSFILKHQLRYDLKYPVSADWDFNIACRLRTEFSYTDTIIAFFNAGGISTRERSDLFFLERKVKYADLYQKYKPSVLQRLGNKVRFTLRKLFVLTQQGRE